MERDMHPISSPLSVRRGAAVAAVALVVLAGLVVVPGARSAAPAPLFEEVDTLDRFPADAREALGPEFVPTWEQVTAPTFNGFTSHRNLVGSIILPEERQLWQLYPNSSTQTGQLAKTAVVVRDLDTMRIVKAMRLPDPARRATKSAGNGGDWAWAADTVHHRLFLITAGDAVVLEVDLRTFVVTRRPLPSEIGQGLLLLVVGGMTYDPHTDSLLILYGGPTTTLV